MEASKQPTPAEMMAILEAATKAVDEANSKAEAQSEASDAAKEEAAAQGHQISKEEADVIAEAIITQFEARGAWKADEGSATGDGSSGGAEQTQVTSPAAPQTVPPAQPGAEPPQPPAADHPPEGVEEPPVKKSLAERFQGK